MFREGYRGFFSCDMMKPVPDPFGPGPKNDVGEADPSSAQLARVIETNMRPGGATFPMLAVPTAMSCDY